MAMAGYESTAVGIMMPVSRQWPAPAVLDEPAGGCPAPSSLGFESSGPRPKVAMDRRLITWLHWHPKLWC